MDLQKLEALAQRGLSDEEMMTIFEVNSFTKAQFQVIKKGRAAGIALVNSKLFDQAQAGDLKAIEQLKKKFEQLKPEEEESYVDRQIAILRNLK